MELAQIIDKKKKKEKSTQNVVVEWSLVDPGSYHEPKVGEELTRKEFLRLVLLSSVPYSGLVDFYDTRRKMVWVFFLSSHTGTK